MENGKMVEVPQEIQYEAIKKWNATKTNNLNSNVSIQNVDEPNSEKKKRKRKREKGSSMFYVVIIILLVLLGLFVYNKYYL